MCFCLAVDIDYIDTLPFAQSSGVTVSDTDFNMLHEDSGDTVPITERLPTWNPITEPFAEAFKKWPKPGPNAGMGCPMTYKINHGHLEKYIRMSRQKR